MDRPTSHSPSRPTNGSRAIANPRRTRLGSAPGAPASTSIDALPRRSA